MAIDILHVSASVELHKSVRSNCADKVHVRLGTNVPVDRVRDVLADNLRVNINVKMLPFSTTALSQMPQQIDLKHNTNSLPT